MSHTVKEKQSWLHASRESVGQVDAIERSLSSEDDCADVLMLLANVRGGINSLMPRILTAAAQKDLTSCERVPSIPARLL
jgi:DNA-binding FrmR family transcriptional regulator